SRDWSSDVCSSDLLQERLQSRSGAGDSPGIVAEAAPTTGWWALASVHLALLGQQVVEAVADQHLLGLAHLFAIAERPDQHPVPGAVAHGAGLQPGDLPEQGDLRAHALGLFPGGEGAGL